LGWKIGRAMIDRSVKPKLLLHEGAFLRPARDADRPCPRDCGELADERSDRSRRRGHNDRLARGGPTDQAQTAISRETRHAEDA